MFGVPTISARSLRAALAAAACLTAPAFGQAYDVYDIGVQFASSINDNGEITGSNLNGHAFHWYNGVLTDLGTLGGSESFGQQINNLGWIAGRSDLVNGNMVAMLYTNSMINLGTLGGSDADARGINDAGVVVGGSWTAGDTHFRPFRYANGVMTDLGSFGGTYAAAQAVNTNGVICGWSDYNSSPSSRRAFIYQNGVMTDLGTFGGATAAFDINDQNRIVGDSENANERARAFVWVNGIMYNYGALPGGRHSYASAINNVNQVVGYSYRNIDGVQRFRAAKYEPTGAKDLNDFISPRSGWDMYYAQDINNHGEIVGWGYHNGNSRGFLLRPRPLILDDPVPGLAGQNNTFTITNAVPGERVYLLYSLRTGTTNLSNYCYAVTLDLRAPTVAGNAIADNNGTATFVGFTPGQASGRTVHYQALDIESCRASNLVSWTYP